VYPSLAPYDLDTLSPCVDQLRDACDHQSSYPNNVCSYFQSSDYNVNSYPYYNVSDEAYARLYSMIETMNERHEHFVSDKKEFGLLYEAHPSVPFPRLEASLYDDCESFLPLELMLLLMHL